VIGAGQGVAPSAVVDIVGRTVPLEKVRAGAAHAHTRTNTRTNERIHF
jgi:hypothetical protein